MVQTEKLQAASTGISKFARYAWGVLAYNLFVIGWGAFVRATGSGAGCGSHWPSCNGQVIPRPEQIETVIEFTHRVTSGLTLVLVGLLLAWAFRLYPRRHPVRASAVVSGVFIILEALVGAGLVLFGLTADNDSIARANVMMLHLVNTLILVAALTLTAWWATFGVPEGFFRRGRLAGLLGLSILAVMVLSASGAIAALGDTLYPASSLAEGLRQDFSSEAALLLRLRIFHPMIAVTTAALAGGVAYWLRRRFAHPLLQKVTAALIGIFLVQIVLGVINVILLAPVWMQVVHLIVSELAWISLIALTAVTLGTADLLPGLVDDRV